MIRKSIIFFYIKSRIYFFYFLSSIKNRKTLGANQPVLILGSGNVRFGKNISFGYNPSPFLLTGYLHIEARNKNSFISIGDNTFLNNNLIIICDKSYINIGNDVLIGYNVEIVDSDFHEINPSKRNSGNHPCIGVNIGNNVFIGANVKILKGVNIGCNSVIAAGSIVTKSFDSNTLIAGNPAIQIKKI